jgi:signal transduction histidine kinase
MVKSSSPDLPRMAVDEVLDLLSDPADRDLAEIVELVASICGGEAAALTIRRGGEYHVVVPFGIDSFVCPARDTFCRVTMSTDGPVVIDDARNDPRFSRLLASQGPLSFIRFYASAPVYAPTGAMVGRLCVVSSQPRQLSTLQRRALETLALSLTKLIELRLLRAQATRTPTTGKDAETLMSQQTAELSHDLRVPLTSMLASVELVQEELGESAGAVVGGLLERARTAADRMGRMIEQHMDHAAVLDQASPHLADLGRVARQVAADHAPVLEPLGAVVEVGALPVVRADADEMYSVFQNLINNSVKFARPDVPARVVITSRRLRDGWRIAVIDNGVGIPPERRVDVFSLFSRVHSGVAGHGIGLATVARIITSYGGRVGAHESLGGGTEIWFDLPGADPDGR